MTLATEIELKLELDAQSVARFRRHPLIRQYRQGRTSSDTLHSTYFDTPDFLLARNKVALRIRKKGSRFIQTLKGRGAQNGLHFERPEWEWDVPSCEIDFALMAETPFVDLWRDPQIAQSIAPLFATEFKRTTWYLGEDDWSVELTLDQGSVCAGPAASPRIAPIDEVELELKQGTAQRLYDLARALTHDMPVRLSLVSKAERGYRLVQNDPLAAVKGGFPAFNNDTTVAEAFRLICQSCLNHALANEPALRQARLPEAVHQMRVALRRLRSALSLFKSLCTTPEGTFLKDEVRWLASELGDARDLDVFRAELLAPVLAARPGDQSLQHLSQVIIEQQDAAYERALAALQSPRCGQLFLDFAAWLEDGDWLHPLGMAPRALLEQSIKAYAHELLSQRARSVARSGKKLRQLTTEQRHALRIKIKKLRYACDFFASLYSAKKTKSYMDALAQMQDRFGALNDAAVAHHRLSILANTSQDSGLAFACGLVSGWHQHRAELEAAACGDEWREFCAHKVFW